MNLRSLKWSRCARLLSLSCVLTLFASFAAGEPVPLERAIRLALAHSTTTAIADADVQRAIANYRELRNNLIPALTVGSGLGWSYGFPLTIEGSAPSLVTATAQSSVFNLAQSQYMGAAKADIRASQFQSKDQKEAVIQDVALSYAELVKWEARLVRLDQDQGQTRQIEKAVAERVQAGVDSTTDLNKAKLASARIRLHIAEARGSADVLRRHLANLTGIPAANFDIVPDSIPAMPGLAKEDDAETKAVSSSPAIKFADQHALAEAMRARAEHRAAIFPTLDFSAQYARLSTINNYQDFYKTFRPDNATIGVAIRLPLFNAVERARAKELDFAATKAKKQAEAARNQVSEETVKLRRAAEQLEAARDVAQLEYELAESARQSAQTRVQSQTGTYHELADAQVQANERCLLYQDTEFEYQRARLNLLRATGELEAWALPGTPSK
ncbi:MAG TPA: TolC family protein [Terriglobales bacterium]|nr:TolC family protein [Terriglobales bacterium]